MLGCARLAEMTGYNEPTIPDDAVIEHVILTDESWETYAAADALGSASARTDVKRRWASANYDTGVWRPALATVGVGVDGGYSKFDTFESCKWVWYPEEGFTFGSANAIPTKHQVVHMRREFYNAMAPGNLADAYIEVMTSGLITARIFVNGLPARPVEVRPRALHYGGVADMGMRRYVFPEHVVYGKNVIGIEATAHVDIDVDGEQVRNYVRDGVIAKVVVR
jgi:hypothetical protein